MATELAARPRSHRSPAVEVCPYCGQALLDHDAVQHCEESEREREHELQAAVEARAAKLADGLASKLVAKHAKQCERLERQLAVREQQLGEAREKHQTEVRDLRIKVRAEAKTEAAREAEAKVKTELRKKDQALRRFQEQIEVQQRQIEHLTADERGELNEERLLLELRSAFPEDRIERSGRGRAGGDILHEVRVMSGAALVKAGLIVYECKDTQAWSNGFLEQAHKEGETHGTPYLVVVSRAFPRNEKTLFVKNGIAVVDPARAVDLSPNHASHGCRGVPRVADRGRPAGEERRALRVPRQQ